MLSIVILAFANFAGRVTWNFAYSLFYKKDQIESQEFEIDVNNQLLEVDQPVLPPVLVPKHYQGEIPTTLPELPSLDQPGT